MKIRKHVPWEDYEKDFIREVAGVFSAALIAEKLERTKRAIEEKARILGVSLALNKAA
ncbi:hypothetical protein PGS49_19690 [Yersinia intermedia]|uniref:hypothetical protein n=1 Tax=Yersinia TaxID=629 RepID=UPI0005DDC5DE|nr:MULTISPECIES: hypothetical protein [Yersinia]MDA5482850.1 hypothetical protein [Yersinia intermedia]CNJ17648.1 Uncharacterised protein [Yersinia aldovae]CRY84446.1 Uncharacterised protein [Yersinia intermedia]